MKNQRGSKISWKVFWSTMALLILCIGYSYVAGDATSHSFRQNRKQHMGRPSLKAFEFRFNHDDMSHLRMHDRRKTFPHSRSFSSFQAADSSDFQGLADDPILSKTDRDDDSWSDYLNTLFDPVFDPDSSSNVSAVIGQMAHLPCRVNNLGTKTVSWIRHHDTHILTVGSFTYTGDTRFSALHREGTNEWTLQIKNPTLNDSGLYECQVSTKPVRAYLVRLDVVVPTTRILYGPDLHTNEGGVLNLTCVVSPSPSPPEYIFWYHKNEVINYETDQRVQVNLHQEADETISSLVVSPAGLNHSGVYKCEPSNANFASIRVHVSKAEEPDALQTSSGRPSIQVTLFLVYPIFLLVRNLAAWQSYILLIPLSVLLLYIDFL